MLAIWQLRTMIHKLNLNGDGRVDRGRGSHGFGVIGQVVIIVHVANTRSDFGQHIFEEPATREN